MCEIGPYCDEINLKIPYSHADMVHTHYVSSGQSSIAETSAKLLHINRSKKRSSLDGKAAIASPQLRDILQSKMWARSSISLTREQKVTIQTELSRRLRSYENTTAATLPACAKVGLSLQILRGVAAVRRVLTNRKYHNGKREAFSKPYVSNLERVMLWKDSSTISHIFNVISGGKLTVVSFAYRLIHCKLASINIFPRTKQVF